MSSRAVSHVITNTEEALRPSEGDNEERSKRASFTKTKLMKQGQRKK